MSAFRIEAEKMTLNGYSIESGSFASGGQFIGLVGASPNTGTASFAFTGSSGFYDVVVGYFDETDGVSHLEVYKQDAFINAWDFNQNLGSTVANTQTLTSRTIATGLSINLGQTIEIRGREDRGEPARLDYIEFIPAAVPIVPIVNDVPIRIEAEEMKLSTYRIDSGSFASDEQFISLAGGNSGETGSASFNFSGPSGLYDVVVRYFDETDGASRLELRKEGTFINAWKFEQNRGSSSANAQTRTHRTIATELVVNKGELIQLQAIESKGEPARIDYIEFIPVTPVTINGTTAAESLAGDAKNNIINGFAGDDILKGGAGHDKLDGGDGIDTVSYTQATNGIIANLNTGIVLAPLYGTLNQPRVMPLGDSITAGKHSVDPTPGAYRTQLWADFLADDLRVNFVGSQSNGPDPLGDKNHEGHSGWRINQITDLVNSGLINTYQSDAVLLMIGTNDTRLRSLSQMYADLSNLIDSITGQAPNTQLLVSSIAPADPAILGKTRADKTKNFNALIPDLVSDKVAQGKKVAFVNAGGSLTLNDLVSDGQHPNAQGYNKLGDAWYDAIVERDTLTGIENITGTAFNDTLVGNAGVNLLKGGAGKDTLTGGVGNDFLSGGADEDTFVYREPTEGRDTITDFSARDIFNIFASGFGGGLRAGTALSTIASETGVFVSSATPTPRGSSANFLYNTTTGSLRFDVDGTGSASSLEVATLNGAPSLSVAQFYIS